MSAIMTGLPGDEQLEGDESERSTKLVDTDTRLISRDARCDAAF